MESIQADRGEGTTREERAYWLFLNGAFERLSPHVWVVENPNRRTAHEVDLAAGTCDCRDHEIHGRQKGFACYHRIAVERYVAWLRKTARDLVPYFLEAA